MLNGNFCAFLHLVHVQGFEVSAVLLNDGRLAEELRKLRISVLGIPESDNNSLTILVRIRQECIY